MKNFNKEKNEVIRQFLLKQIKKIKNSDNKYLFDPYQLHEYLKKREK